jgi:biopolymer transport protein ExbD
MHDVNMVPLIDVALALVVILLLVTPIAFESSIAVRRAAVAARDADRTERMERVEIRILDEGHVRVNRTELDRAELAGALRPLLDVAVPPAVVVACADAVSHGTFVGVLDEAKSCGAAEIAVVGD